MDMINADRKGRYHTRRSGDGSASGAEIYTASGARLAFDGPSTRGTTLRDTTRCYPRVETESKGRTLVLWTLVYST